MPDAPWAHARGVAPVLDRWLASSWVKPCFCADETFGRREGSYADIPPTVGPGLVRALRRRRRRAALLAPGRGRRGGRRRPARRRRDAHGERQEPLLPPARARGAARATPTRAPSTSSRPRRSPATRRRACASSCARAGVDLGAVVYDGDTPADARRAARERARHRADQPGHAAHRDPAAPRALGAHAAAPAVRGGRRAAHVQGRLRLARRERAAAARARRALPRVGRPQFIGATATIGNPREHAARLFGVRQDEVELVGESGAPAGRAAVLPLQPAGGQQRARDPRELREAGRHARGRPGARARCRRSSSASRGTRSR